MAAANAIAWGDYMKIQMMAGAAALVMMTACSAPVPVDPDAATEAANLAQVQQMYGYFETGDVPSFLGALDAGIVWNEAENFPYAKTNPHVGPDAVVAGVFGPMAQDWSAFAVVPETYLADGDKVAMFGRYEATSAATGKPMNPQVVHVWTLKDGKAIAFQQYADTLATRMVLTPDADE